MNPTVQPQGSLQQWVSITSAATHGRVQRTVRAHPMKIETLRAVLAKVEETARQTPSALPADTVAAMAALEDLLAAATACQRRLKTDPLSILIWSEPLKLDQRVRQI